MILSAQCAGITIQIQPYILAATVGGVGLSIIAYAILPTVISRIGSPTWITNLRKLRNAFGRIGIVIVVVGGLFLMTIWMTRPECF